MIINIQNGKDLFTFDVTLQQIRYCHNIKRHGRIDFHELSQTDTDCYKYLYENNRAAFVQCLTEDFNIHLTKEAA